MKHELKQDQLYLDLVEVAEKLFAVVRRDEGLFKTGSCTLRGEKIIFLNNHQPLEERIAALAQEIAHQGAEKYYLKPVVRAEVERYNETLDAAAIS